MVNAAVPAVAGLRVTVGDEFQGSYATLGAAVDAALRVRLRCCRPSTRGSARPRAGHAWTPSAGSRTGRAGGRRAKRSRLPSRRPDGACDPSPAHRLPGGAGREALGDGHRLRRGHRRRRQCGTALSGPSGWLVLGPFGPTAEGAHGTAHDPERARRAEGISARPCPSACAPTASAPCSPRTSCSGPAVTWLAVWLVGVGLADLVRAGARVRGAVCPRRRCRRRRGPRRPRRADRPGRPRRARRLARRARALGAALGPGAHHRHGPLARSGRLWPAARWLVALVRLGVHRPAGRSGAGCVGRPAPRRTGRRARGRCCSSPGCCSSTSRPPTSSSGSSSSASGRCGRCCPLGPASEPQPSDQLRGGRLLGPMERVLILGLGLAGQLTAAGLVIAAKGLIRFPELQAKRDDSDEGRRRRHRRRHRVLPRRVVRLLARRAGHAGPHPLGAHTLTMLPFHSGGKSAVVSPASSSR